MSSLRLWTLVGSTVLAVACVPEGKPAGRLGVEVPEVEESSPLALSFESAAEEHDVPVDLLKALAYEETRFSPAVGEVEFEGQEQPFGLFALSGATLERGAALIGKSVDEVMTDDQANVAAAAALLSLYADAVKLDPELRSDPAAWKVALMQWGALDADLAGGFAEQVIDHARRGMAVPLPDGTTLVIGRAPEVAQAIETSESGLGATGVLWRPSPNYNSRNGTRVEMVVIHTCEGDYSGCVGWLRNSQSRVSAHYVVSSGHEVSQLVDENNRAWHVAASYRSSVNSGQLANKQGQSVNTFSVGIEHAGRASQPSWPQSQIDRSVQLVRDITAHHNIPRDRYHIVAHGRLQPENRIDPGPNWPWTSYIAAIASGSATPPPPPPTQTGGGSGGGGSGGTTQVPPPSSSTIITVDNRTTGRFRASGNWEVSSWAADRVGADYRYRSPAETSDLAEFRIPIASAGRYEVFTRVPGNGYSQNAPFFIHHAGGTATVMRNIASRGAEWVSLGEYNFAAGDDWIVQLSCWTGARGYLIADAIKLERR